MAEREITLQDIKRSLFDPTQNERTHGAQWRIGVDAIPVEALPPDQQQEVRTVFDPAAFKIERVSAQSPKTQAVIGGLCSIFTGDLNQRNVDETVKQLRMDQIVEAVGNVRGKPIFIVIEDSFFSRLTGVPVTEFQRQAAMATDRIVRWLELSTGETPDLRVALTSDPNVEQGLYDAVAYMADDVLKNPDFSRMQSAPILMMYTSVWTDLLASLSYVPSGNVVCVEPVEHFVDNRSFPDQRLRYAYEDFTQWLKDNPYAKPKSANATLGIAGFMESVDGDQNKKRTRLLPAWKVPSTANVRIWAEKLQEKTIAFPFPLRNSPVFTEAVNWGLWNPAIREQVASLICLEEAYYRERDAMKVQTGNPSDKQERAQKLRRGIGQQAEPITKQMAKEVAMIVTTVLGK
ncbi:hypothetical protein HY950_01145 [Candidatus Gottesmanbacteria bacterium]|nr:hypothetical protein [Candidatus Gottesmanbacteria bacterium]